MKHAGTRLWAVCLLLVLAGLPRLSRGETSRGNQAAAHLPDFSWDTVPRAIYAHKPSAWTDEDYTRIARFGVFGDGFSAAGSRAAAEVKAFNPRITVLGYKNLVIHYQGTQDPLFVAHPEWFLHSGGKPELHGSGRIRHPLYDLRRAEVRDFWLNEVDRLLHEPALDGVFIDAYAKVVNYAPVMRATGQNPPVEFIAAYHRMMDEHLQRAAGCGKIRIGNYLRAATPDCAIPEVMTYLDGSYLEWFDHIGALPAHLHSYEEYVAAGIQAVQQVAQAGKMIWLHLEAVEDADVQVTADGADPAAAAPSSQPYQNLAYKLAMFLICAERNSYFQYQAAYKATEDVQSWAPEFPEFRKPLGPPRGPAQRSGFTYTREFQYASVWLDLALRQGRITWKGSYPEAARLLPRRGDDQVATGAFSCRIEFDRPVNKGAGAISLHRMRDRRLLACVAVESAAVTLTGNRAATIELPAVLEPATEYSVTVEPGAFADCDGMKFLGMPVLGEWKFKTLGGR